nr:hypothetical protein [Streptomyces tardus]
MSAPDLLVVIDPAARRYDAEAVRIARDVLCAGSPGAKVCLPDGPEAVVRALARRGHRQPVVVGDDRTLGLAVRQLHQEHRSGTPAADETSVEADAPPVEATDCTGAPYREPSDDRTGAALVRDPAPRGSRGDAGPRGDADLGVAHHPDRPPAGDLRDRPGRSDRPDGSDRSGRSDGHRFGHGHGYRDDGGEFGPGDDDDPYDECAEGDSALDDALGSDSRDGTGGGRGRNAMLLACVPVGPPESLELARGLGLPMDVVSAARAVLGGGERPLGLLVDDRDAVLAGALRIPAVPAQREPVREERAASGVLGQLSRRAALVRPAVLRHLGGDDGMLPRLRVEADGVLLADPARPVVELSVSVLADRAREGLAEVVVRQPAASALGARGAPPSEVRVAARTVTVSGPDGDTRTWRVAPAVLRLTVPV